MPTDMSVQVEMLFLILSVKYSVTHTGTFLQAYRGWGGGQMMGKFVLF